MFLGHLAVGFASKRVAPQMPLGPLMAAPLFLDLLWPIFLLAGWEKVEIAPGDTAFTPLHFVSYPYTHSLLTAMGWGALLGAFYGRRRRDAKVAIVIALGVISHWVLDFVTHRPDLPISPAAGSTRLGLGLWNSISGTIAVEGLMFAAAVGMYAAATRAQDRIGSAAFWSFVVFAVLVYVSNLMGPPPPSVTALTWVALSLWLIPFWVNGFDRHRSVRT